MGLTPLPLADYASVHYQPNYGDSIHARYNYLWKFHEILSLPHFAGRLLKRLSGQVQHTDVRMYSKPGWRKSPGFFMPGLFS